MMMSDDWLSKQLASLKDALRSPPLKARLKGSRRITNGAWLPPLFIRPNQFNDPIFPDYSIIYRDENLGAECYVGRIFLAGAGVPKDTPWTWSVEFHQRAGRVEPHDGNEATEEKAKAAWKRCWESGRPPINWPVYEHRRELSRTRRGLPGKGHQ
jgi:hypothetical protein